VSLLLLCCWQYRSGVPEEPPTALRLPNASAAPAQSAATQAAPIQRKLIKNTALTLRVPQMIPASERIRAKASELGGFVSNSRFGVNSDHDEAASVDAKVPAQKLDLFSSGNRASCQPCGCTDGFAQSNAGSLAPVQAKGEACRASLLLYHRPDGGSERQRHDGLQPDGRQRLESAEQGRR